MGRFRSPAPPAPALAALVLAAAASSCVQPPQGRVYVTSGFEDRIYVLDAATGTVLDTVVADPRFGEVDEPHGVTVSPDGDHWYATLSHGDPTLWKFETGSNRLVGRVTLPQSGASRIGISPDGTVGAVPDYFRAGQGAASKLTLVSLHALEIRTTAEPCEAPHDVQFSPGGRTVAVTCALGDEVVLLDAATLEVVRRTRFGDGARPMNLVWSPDGGRVIVTLMGESRVVSLDPTSGEIHGTVGTGLAPAQIAMAPDGALVATANRGDGTVSLLDTETLTERRRIQVPGEHPHGATFDDRGEAVFVTYEGTTHVPGGVIALNRAGALLWHTVVGNFTLGVAYSASPS